MRIVNVADAREQIGKLLRAVERGEEIIIQRYKKSIAKLVPVEIKKPIFSDLTAFRAKQKSQSKTSLSQLRQEERY